MARKRKKARKSRGAPRPAGVTNVAIAISDSKGNDADKMLESLKSNNGKL